MITLIGMGSGTPESLTAQGLAALQNAGLILGQSACWNSCRRAARITGRPCITLRCPCRAGG